MRPLSERQAQMLRDVARDGGFDFLDPTDYHSSGALWWFNRERVIAALESKGLILDGNITDKGREALAQLNGGTNQ
jgi:hypothetical protein